jgi:hypothetical protein
MALEINFEEYNSQPSLYANAGDYVSGQINFSNDYNLISDESNPFEISPDGSKISRADNEWGTSGFSVGEVVTIAWDSYSPISGFSSFVRTITYISDGFIYLNSPITGDGQGAMFPEDGLRSGLNIYVDKDPESVEFRFNLVQNGNESDESLIDGEMNRFVLDGADALGIGSTAPMPQKGNKSGGHVVSVILKLVSIVGTKRNYQINYIFFDWLIIQDGYGQNDYTLNSNKLLYYKGADHIAPFSHIKTMGRLGDPNSIFEDQTHTTQANTGDQGENYNGGENVFSLDSINWFNPSGVIEAMDLSGSSSFVAVVTAPDQNTLTSTFRIGACWLPSDESEYKNLPLGILNNLIANPIGSDFAHSVTPDPTVYIGYTSKDGCRLDMTDIQFEIVGSTVVVSGTIIPNGDFTTKFSQLGEGDRRIRIWARFEDPTLAINTSNRVNLPLFDQDCYDAPAIGVIYPYFVRQFVYDHALNQIIQGVYPNTTHEMITEDDVLFQSVFQLVEGESYDGIYARIYASNSLTGEEFTLEDRFIDFDNDDYSPFIIDRYQLDYTENRSLGLPNESLLDVIKLEMSPSDDAPGFYGVKLSYGFLARWEYWIEQANANDDFFDLSEPNKGLNKDWRHYQENPDWGLNLYYYVRKDGVDDYVPHTFTIRDFEDVPEISTLVTFTRSNGNEVTALPINDLVEVKVDFTWDGFDFVDPVVEFKVEPFEGAPPVYVSSILTIGVEGLPFKPISGETMIDVSFVGNICTAKCLIDTSLIDVEKVSLSYWFTDDGVITPDGAIYEDGDFILLEDGDSLIYE